VGALTYRRGSHAQRLDMVDVGNSTDLVGMELKLRRLLVTLVRRASTLF
jgi:hypothetical protein